MRKRIVLVLCWLIGFLATSQQSNYIIEYISSQEGLSHNYVSKVVSDSLNIKWIATENGITKYDGTNFYTYQPNNYPALENENIETLFVDKANNLWIGTKSGGISKLDIATNRLTSYNYLLGDKNNYRIKDITQDNDGNIWIGTNQNGMYIIDPVQSKLLKHDKFDLVRFIKKDSKGNIWFNAGYSLKKYNTKTKKTTSYFLKEFISTIVEDKKNNCMWVGVINYGEKNHLIKLDLTTYKTEKIYTGIPSSFTNTLFIEDDKLWIGTWGKGLYVSDYSKKKFSKLNLVYPPNATRANNYDIILDIHKDATNVIWIATDFGSIVKLSKQKGFQNLDQVATDKSLLNGMNFHASYLSEDHIFLGTLRNGLFYGKDLENLKQHKTIKELKIYSLSMFKNKLLVGTNHKIFILNQKFEITDELNIPQATCFFPKDANNLWIGTQQNGIFNVDFNTIKPIIGTNYNSRFPKVNLKSNRITGIQKDLNNNIWVSTYDGLHLYNKTDDNFIHHTAIASYKLPKILNTMFVDDSHIWLGTSQGLLKMLYSHRKLTLEASYNQEKNGLKNNFIGGIVDDNEGNLWITTATSLAKFDKEEAFFINYDKTDGVYTSLFNSRVLISNSNKTVILAPGTDNLTYFNPEVIRTNPIIDQLHFSSLEIDHTRVHANDTVFGKVILTKDINYTTSLEIPHQAKSFSVAFSNTDYSTISNTHYRYKLQGIDKKWIPINESEKINFTGLAPGNYTLQVSGSKDYKNWNTPTSLHLNVLYAPWFSPWAYSIYAIVFLLVLWIVISNVIKHYTFKNRMKREQELSEAKFTFFTNISHEFRTPLTLILSPLKELIRKNNSNPEVTEKLITMEKNADRLLNLITQLLDYRKAEHGLLKTTIVNGDFAKFSREIFLYFKEQAALKKIAFTYRADNTKIAMAFDRNKMEIILCNLISNALKYSKQGDSVTISVVQENNNCVFTVADTGIGMSAEATEKIFDRFYQIKSTNTSNIMGSGIGLSFTKKLIELHGGTIAVNSQINVGTSFTVTLPITASNINPQKPAVAIDQKVNIKEVDNLQVNTKENTLLIVDDNDDIRNYLQQLLRDDYTILIAKDGVEAVEMAREHVPDLILCDIMMPRKDGLEASKEIKATMATSHIPIILLTARSSNMYEIKGLETGADDFLTKPFDPEVIKARISSALQNRAKIREHLLNKVRFEPSKTTTEKTETAEEIFIAKAINLVEENLTNDAFDIKMMQDKLFMSQSSMYRKIKSLTGLSLTGFIRSIRLKKAAELILTTDLKLNAVAISVGFNDNKYFRESFKKQYGCLPSEYKKNKNI